MLLCHRQGQSCGTIRSLANYGVLVLANDAKRQLPRHSSLARSTRPKRVVSHHNHNNVLSTSTILESATVAPNCKSLLPRNRENWWFCTSNTMSDAVPAILIVLITILCECCLDSLSDCGTLTRNLLVPPVGVFMISGCGADLLVNICLTLLGYFPGHIHAFYLEYIYFDRREKGRTPYKRTVQALLIRFIQAASDNCLLVLLRVCTRITFSPAARGVMGLSKRKGCGSETSGRVLRRSRFAP